MSNRFLKILRSRWYQRKRYYLDWLFLSLISVVACFFSMLVTMGGNTLALDANTSFNRENHSGELLDYRYHTKSDLLLWNGNFLTQFLERTAMKSQPVLEIIGSSGEEEIVLAQKPKSIELLLQKSERHKLSANHHIDQEFYLTVENITALKKPIDSYSIYVNLSPEVNPSNCPQLKAGIIPAFGIINASQSCEGCTGEGLTYSFNITDVIFFLEGQGLWNSEKCLITFVSLSTKAERETVPKLQPVKIGRVKLYIHET